MTMIIRDGKALSKAVTAFAKKHGAYKGASEALAWEVVAHTAKHGDCSVLKKFYAGLDQAWARSFNYWFGEMIVNSDYAFIDPETEKAVRWVNLRDGEFTVRKGAENARHYWLERVMEDDSRIGFLSMPRKESEGSTTFDNLKLMEEFKKLLKKASRDDSAVSKKIVEVLDEMAVKIEKIIASSGVKVVTTEITQDDDDEPAMSRVETMREANLIAA